jgi:hypothetical protein
MSSTDPLAVKLARIRIAAADWPRCGRCEMPVEVFYADVTEESVILVAQCHGSVQAEEVPDALWDSYSPADFRLGPAFAARGELTDDD